MYVLISESFVIRTVAVGLTMSHTVAVGRIGTGDAPARHLHPGFRVD